MKKIGIFIAEGCEEIEALTVVDLVRRANDIDIISISVTGKKEVTSSHKVTFLTDEIASEVNFDDLDGIVLPGGMPGTLNLGDSEVVNKVIREFASAGKLVSAICAAPSVLGEANLLEGKKAACYPGFEDKLLGAEIVMEPVAIDGNVITSRGMGTAIDFGLEIIAYFCGNEEKERISKAIIYK